MKVKLAAILLIGLFALTFGIPAQANGIKPPQALGSGDAPGWNLYSEGSVGNLNWSDEVLSGFSMWYQIWFDNTTFIDSTKGVALMLISFPFSIGDIWWLVLKEYFVGVFGGITVDIPGLEHAIWWSNGGVYLGLGTNDKMIIFVLGYGSNETPSDPFTGWFLVKTPTNTSATQLDIVSILTMQGAMFVGIPGFEILTVFATLLLVVAVVLSIRKHKISLGKTF